MEQIKQETKEYDVQPDDVDTPQEQQRLFKNLDSLLDYCKWTRPSQFNVRSGVSEGASVWELVYVNSNGRS